MTIQERIKKLADDRGWTEYRLSKECGLSQSTIGNILRRNSIPSITTLETICDGLGITLSQFFANDELIELSDDTRELFEQWNLLSSNQRKAIIQVINAMITR